MLPAVMRIMRWLREPASRFARIANLRAAGQAMPAALVAAASGNRSGRSKLQVDAFESHATLGSTQRS